MRSSPKPARQRAPLRIIGAFAVAGLFGGSVVRADEAADSASASTPTGAQLQEAQALQKQAALVMFAVEKMVQEARAADDPLRLNCVETYLKVILERVRQGATAIEAIRALQGINRRLEGSGSVAPLGDELDKVKRAHASVMTLGAEAESCVGTTSVKVPDLLATEQVEGAPDSRTRPPIPVKPPLASPFETP